MKITIDITSCKRCPYFKEASLGFEDGKLTFSSKCLHPSADITSFQENGTIPSWCPELSNETSSWVKLPRNDPALLDYLEDHGYVGVVKQLRGIR